MEREEAIEIVKEALPTLWKETKDAIQTLIPELTESEDERIRKELLEEIEFIIPHDDETDSEGLILPSYHARIDRYKSYLEKQKEQKPESCDCSRDEESYINGIHHVLMNPEAYEEFKKEWRQFDRFRKATWKPSEEQMEALKDAFRKDGGNEYRKVINSLYCDLQKLL